MFEFLLVAEYFIVAFGGAGQGRDHYSWVKLYQGVPEPLELMGPPLDLPAETDCFIFVPGGGFDGQDHLCELYELLYDPVP